MWKLWKFALTLFDKDFVKATVFSNTVVTEELILRNIFGEDEFFIFPHCVP